MLSDKYPLDSISHWLPFHSSLSKNHNGVSIISKIKSSQGCKPVFVTEEMRSIAATGDIRVINFYVVNGQSLTRNTHKIMAESS